MSETKLLTFELSADGDEIDIHLNKSGLEDLILYLRRLLDASSELPRHDHLMTNSWAGYELTEEKQGAESQLIHKVNLRYWG